MAKENEIERANNKLLSVERLLLNSTVDELEIMRELAEGNGATASMGDLQLEETFFNDLEELMANIIAEKILLRLKEVNSNK